MGLMLEPTTLRDARRLCIRWHRHHRPPQGGLFAIACSHDDRLFGVVIVGRPTARNNDDGYTAEVTRLATDGTKNACSFLYAAAWRACRACGYRKLVTYILNSEPGTSLRAADWHCVGECGGGKWSRRDRPRADDHPTQLKMRYEVTPKNGA